MHLLIIGGSREGRLRTAAASSLTPGLSGRARVTLDAVTWPFMEPGSLFPSAGPQTGTPRLIRIDGLERAFPDNQAAGTRLVLTQSMYIVQKLIDALGDDDIIVATADAGVLERHAPEAFQRRGPWRFFDIITTPDQGEGTGTSEVPPLELPGPVADRLAAAYASGSPANRVALCKAAVDAAPGSAVARLALGSALREQQEMDAARGALDRAIELAPEWEAAHYETGKFWLGYDDMERARDAFQRAADVMPTFAAAYSNLGATLGELDDPDAALAAFSHALAHDPTSFTILNNVGVVSRELGRLDQSEQALTRVVALAPDYVFGYYNLGHTRFLRGDYAGALEAYEEGQRRDPEKNRRQGCRLALVRFANGDAAGADRDLWRFADQAAADEREDLLLEAYEIAQALVQAHPELAAHQEFLDRIARGITL